MIFWLSLIVNVGKLILEFSSSITYTTCILVYLIKLLLILDKFISEHTEFWIVQSYKSKTKNVKIIFISHKSNN